MALERDDFRPYSLFVLGERLVHLELRIEPVLGSQVTESSQFEMLMDEINSLDAVLIEAGLEDSRDWLAKQLLEIRESYRKCQAEGTSFTFPGPSWWNELDNRLRVELNNFPAVILPESRIEREDLEDVSRRFSVKIFDSLPAIARRDFQEAAKCYLFGQYTAAVMLSWRATEATLREYCYRLTGKENRGQAWEAILKELLKWNDQQESGGKLRQNLLGDISSRKEDRNIFAHPEQRFEPEMKEMARSWIESAIRLSSDLVLDWRKRRKSLSIGVPEGLDPDISLALYILERNGGGIGRLAFLKESEYDSADYDFVLGMADGKFGWRALEAAKEDIAKKGIAALIAEERGCENDYEELSTFATDLRFKNSEAPLVESKSPEFTLEMLLQEIKRTNPDPVDYRKETWILFEEILNGGFAPRDSYLAQDLSSHFSRYVQGISTRLNDKKVAWQARLEDRYDGAQAVICAARYPLFDQLKSEAFKDVYEMIACTDEAEQVWISVKKGSSLNLNPLYRVLKEKTGREFENSAGRLIKNHKDNKVTLQAIVLKEIIKIANPLQA